ncbi:SET and MYND domain-containing protein DDB_G0284059 [Hyalella azteca]|uniref:Protein-lysine N-methyltransferase SMYD4 n=1 Tax=Hyalella azteca TaxID=294128 RepID=A0A8B7N8Q6_HYAAZ|nr:SET and MYND domain-containing protein DDB_G0284059 [Hyalella azteca]
MEEKTAMEQRADGDVSFSEFYSRVCDRIRSENILDTVMKEFQQCSSDQQRISYVWNLPETRQLSLKHKTSFKSREEAAFCEDLYDRLVVDERNADKALEAIQRAILKTPTADKHLLAVRFMKRAWALLLMEKFTEAFVDAKRAIISTQTPGVLWNAHEILGHCNAKARKFKEAEANFAKALESLKKSKASNVERAAVAGRVSTVLRMVKDENKPKNRSKESAKKLEENRTKKNTTRNTDTLDEVSAPTTASDVSRSRKLPKLSYGTHPKLVSASVAVRVVVTEERGRAVVASRDIKPGSVVMVEQPYAYTVNASQLHERCLRCCRRSLTNVPCDNCAVVQYCGESCARQAAQQHRLQCCVLTLLYDAALGNMAPLVFRILSTIGWTKLKKSQEKLCQEQELAEQKERSGPDDILVSGHQPWGWEGQYSPHDYLATFNLVTNSSKRTFGDLFKRALSAAYLTHCLLTAGFFAPTKPTEEELQFTATLALRHLQSSSCNAYEISEMQITGDIAGNKSLEIGGAIYPTISLTNHSCFPNVTRYNVGTACVLRATRFIPRDAEILDNYGYFFHATPLIERRDALRNQYKFDCSCDACTYQWPLYPHQGGEPVVFRCPVSTCQAPSSLGDGLKKKCRTCGDEKDYGKLVSEISDKLPDYSKAIQQMQSGRFETALQTLVQHQAMLDGFAVYPAKHYTDVQEIMRQCMSSLGNVNHCEATNTE